MMASVLRNALLPLLVGLTLVIGGSPAEGAWVGPPLSGRDSGGGEAAAAPMGFSFAAAGDHGANASTAASLAALDQSGAAFYLALGDMDYDQTASDEAWCSYVTQGLPTLGGTFPFELVAGNHEEQGGPDGYILNHAACLPDRLNENGVYAAEYYFDYPQSEPLLRVIMIAADLQVAGVSYDYTIGSVHYNWLASAIDGARAAGIPWVAVGMHKNCITTGQKTCEIGTALLNLLVDKRVDIIFQGHDHNYQRSKQLALNAGTCAGVPTNAFDADCVADTGADGAYTKGAGTVIVISGAFGRCCYAVNASDSEAGYFAEIDATSDGFMQLTVLPGRIDAQFVASTGSFADNFSILDAADADGDGFSGAMESYLGTDMADSCGDPAGPGGPSLAWPADLKSSAPSVDDIDVSDLATYVAPVRRLGAAMGSPDYNERWDLNASGTVDVSDLAVITLLYPPMFGGGVRAFNGPACG